MKQIRSPSLLVLVLTLAAPALGQSINIDVGCSTTTLPLAAAGGQNGQWGEWNHFNPTAPSAALVDLLGGATTATVSASPSGGHTCEETTRFATGTFERAFYDDFESVPGPSATTTWTVAGLTPGRTYTVILWCWDPASPANVTRVSLPSTAPVTSCGGWGGSGFANAGGAFVRADVAASNLGEVTWTIAANSANERGVLNAIQLSDPLEYRTLPFNYCTGGTTSQGCGGRMHSFGTPSSSNPSEFTLAVDGITGGARTCVFFYSLNGPAAVPFCASAGTMVCVRTPYTRFGAGTANGGSPCGGYYARDFGEAIYNSVPNWPVPPGARVNAQAWWRDNISGCPMGKQMGLSDGIEFVMAP